MDGAGSDDQNTTQQAGVCGNSGQFRDDLGTDQLQESNVFLFLSFFLSLNLYRRVKMGVVQYCCLLLGARFRKVWTLVSSSHQ